MKYLIMCCVMSVAVCGVLQAADPKVECYGWESRMIYHSPETPGFTCWVGLAKAPDNKLLLSFSQVTGKGADAKGEDVVLESGDAGGTWTRVKPDGYVGFIRQSTILPDGTIVKATWPSGNDSSYVLRSTDRGHTWEKRIDFVDPKKYKAWPGVIKPLRDGRLVLFAGVLKRDPAKPNDDDNTRVVKDMFLSADGGKSWGKPIQLVKMEEGLCEESDFCELPNGDLFWIHRAAHYPDHLTEIPAGAQRSQGKENANPPQSYWYSDRLQSIAYKRGGTFVAGKVTNAPIPHSGYPTVLYTKEGLIMHLGTDGVNWSADAGKTWHRLNSPGTDYYPIARQLDDGEIIVVSHRGGDDVYGSVDQAIMQQKFRLRVSRPGDAAPVGK